MKTQGFSFPMRFLTVFVLGCATALVNAQETPAPATPPAPARVEQGVLLDRVAAVVNEGVVLQSELDEQVALISSRLRSQNLNLPPPEVMRQQVLERLIMQEIQMQRAKRAGLAIPDDMVNNALEDVARQNRITLSQLPEALAQQGVDYGSYREAIRKELTLSLLLARRLGAPLLLYAERESLWSKFADRVFLARSRPSAADRHKGMTGSAARRR